MDQIDTPVDWVVDDGTVEDLTVEDLTAEDWTAEDADAVSDAADGADGEDAGLDDVTDEADAMDLPEVEAADEDVMDIAEIEEDSGGEVACEGVSVWMTPEGCDASSAHPGYECSLAMDDNTGTYWTTDCAAAPQWIYFDMGSKMCISGVNVYLADMPVPETMNIEISDDASSWSAVASAWTVSMDYLWRDVAFTETAGRYIRLYITSFQLHPEYCGGSDLGYASISEFQSSARTFTGTVP